MPVSWKLFNSIAAAVFVVFSLLQWNDLDPVVYDDPSIADAIAWGVFYAFIAVLFALVLVRHLPRWLLAVGVVVCLAQLGRTAPGLWENITGDRAFNITQGSMSANDARIELSREFFGALLALVSVGIVAFENTRLAKLRGDQQTP